MNSVAGSEIGMIEPIEAARAELGKLLIDHMQGIDAARNMSYPLEDPEQNYIRYKQLSAMVVKHFGIDEQGYPRANSGLFEMGDEKEEPNHNPAGFIAQEGDKKGQIISAKGLLFTVNWQGTIFECFILDGGLSRKFFDDKSPEQQLDYMQRYLDRRHSYSRDHYGEVVRSPDYFAIAGVNQAGQYQVEQIIPYAPRIVPIVPAAS